MNLYDKIKNEKRLAVLNDELEYLRNIKTYYMNNMEFKFKYFSGNDEVEAILDKGTVKFLKFMNKQEEPICKEIYEVLNKLNLIPSNF